MDTTKRINYLPAKRSRKKKEGKKKQKQIGPLMHHCVATIVMHAEIDGHLAKSTLSTGRKYTLENWASTVAIIDFSPTVEKKLCELGL